MTKKITLILISVILLVCITLATWSLYQQNHYPSRSSHIPNINLISIDYAFQLGYNVCSLVIGILVLFIAYNQLSKTREATTISSLTSNAEKWNGNYMTQKRSELAELILANSTTKLDPLNNNELTTWFKNIPQKSKLSEEKIREIAIVNKKFEVIAYEFEILGYYYKRGIYSPEDIYELFGYELQQYWLLFVEIGFIEYLRDKEKGGENGFYDKFEKLFNDTIKYEIPIKSKLWFWSIKNKIDSLKREKIGKMGFFLLEESPNM